MSELRWNPLLRTWTMVASHRQNRPQMPKDWCPFCPGSGRVPDEYDVYKYDNDFPALSQNPPKPDDVGSDLYQMEPAYGKCEVILYSSEHRKTLCQLPLDHIKKLVDLWISRVEELSKDRKIQYVFPFENKGEEVGVTMPHPHGQIYAYSFVPQKLKVELDSAKEFYEKKGKCIICQMNEDEIEFKKRILFENEHFIAYLPYFTDYPYGIFIVSKNHKSLITDFNERERLSLAQILKIITGSFEVLFDRPFPYMMVMHQSPVNAKEYKDSNEYFHFHIEFYPPLRARDEIKYYASSEMGAWAAANIAAVEETAKEMRIAKLRYLSKGGFTLIKQEFVKEFVSIYGGKVGDVSVFSAPARVNLIGEHIDYNGGLVFPAALDINIYMAIRKRKDGQIYFKDMDFPGEVETGINNEMVKGEDVSWANYPKGVLKVLREKGYKFDSGFETLFSSDIPHGAGVSSSAAFEVVFAYGISEIFSLRISKRNIALLCQKAENEFVGVNCGIMDQFAVAMGEKNHSIMLNCNTLDYQLIPLELEDYKLVLVNTNKERKLSDSKYNERRAECEQGLKELQKVINIPNLCGLDSKKFEELKNNISSPIVRKRVKHVVSENERVKSAGEALRKGNLREFGRLMEKSHSSLRDDYEVTGIELDTLFEKARKFDGCIGTRMTGAGFGGCTVNLVHKDKIEDFKSAVADDYTKETGLIPSFYVCEVGDGVKQIS